MKKIKNLKQKLESSDYLSALSEMGIPKEIITMFERPFDMTRERWEEVTRLEDGDYEKAQKRED